ncbi:MAG: alpha/beta hydrolase [Planctomycetes bacterium]|nr:alpha/beta hydrolase [Planctomycetota bacterium]
MTHWALLIIVAFVSFLAVFIQATKGQQAGDPKPATQPAGQPKAELLWPDGAPKARGKTDADKPAIFVHLPPADKANGAAMVVCPGGGYNILMMTYEGHDIAKWLNDSGIAAIVLKYRVKYPHPAPMLDAQRAMRTVRANAKQWNIDPNRIGMIGFSAGGHVASTVGTHFDDGDPKAADPIERVSCRPDFLVLVYPLISFADKGNDIIAKVRTAMLGSAPAAADVDFISNEKQVTEKTPPAFLVHSKLDKMVPVEHSAMFYAALKEKKVPAEFLEIPTGGHGLGCGKGDEWKLWQEKAMEWIKSMGFLKPKDK